MGLTVSWLAVKGAPKADVLGFLGVFEMDVQRFPGEDPMSCLEFPGGWLVIFHRDYDWADAKQVRAVSQFGLTVGCQFSEHVGESEARGALDGEDIWYVSDKGGVETVGSLPPEWAAIEARLRDDPNSVYDAPQDLAEAICGYRADEFEEPFTVLDGPAVPSKKREGLFGRLLKRRV